MDDDSDESQKESLDFTSSLDTSVTPSCFRLESNSPSYVKWDFDLPPVSEKIKKEVKELGEQLRDQCPIRKRKLRRRSSYSLTKKNLDSTPSRNLSYQRSIKQLKEAINGTFHVPENLTAEETTNNTLSTECSTSKVTDETRSGSLDIFDDDETEKKYIPKENQSLILENKDVFDDSFNDLLNDCSPLCENRMYKNTTPKKHTSTDENIIAKSVGITDTPVRQRTSIKGIKCTPRDLTLELHTADDDDLFLAIDI